MLAMRDDISSSEVSALKNLGLKVRLPEFWGCHELCFEDFQPAKIHWCLRALAAVSSPCLRDLLWHHWTTLLEKLLLVQ